MEIKETVQIIASVVGIFTSVIAVIISVFSLKQTQKSIKDANRPYVVVYRDYIQVLGNIQEHIIIKNFGKTGAIIKSLSFDPTYKDSMRKKEIFKNISETFIAPSQSISTITSNNTFEGERNGIIKAEITYCSGKEYYKDIFTLNEELLHDLSFSKTKPSKSKKLEEVIVKSVQEVLRRKL